MVDQITQTSPTKDDCNIGMLAHLLGIFTGFLGPLVVWLAKKDDSPFVAEQAKEALNFQITIALAFVVSWVLAFILIGLVLMPVLFIVNVVFCILAAVSASKGNSYQYPVALRLLN
jgi:uncharacterized Tic20 family protein